MFSEVRALLVCVALVVVGCSAPAAQATSTHLSTAVRNVQLGQVIDGVPCLSADLPEHHVHVHLQILDDGSNVTVPAGIGVGRPLGMDPGGFIATGACFAWIHTHDTTGVVHVVTAEEKTFTLGQFFEVWGQPLGPGLAIGYKGSVAVFVNGERFGGDPRDVKLASLENIVIELGRAPSKPAAAAYDFGTMSR